LFRDFAFVSIRFETCPRKEKKRNINFLGYTSSSNYDLRAWYNGYYFSLPS
jgi:hypothetical protein